MYGLDSSSVSLLGFAVVFLVGGFVMYLISLFSMKETSYEDVMEEQKRKKEKEDKARSMLNKQKRDQYKKKFELKKKKGAVGNGKIEKIDSGVSPMHEVQIKETPVAASEAAQPAEPKKTKAKVAKKTEQRTQVKQDSPKGSHSILKPSPEKPEHSAPVATDKPEEEIQAEAPKKKTGERTRTVSFSDETTEKPKTELEPEKSKKKKKKSEPEVESAIVTQVRETALTDRDVQNILTLIRQKHGIDIGGGNKIKDLQHQLDIAKKQLSQQESSMQQYVSRCMGAESKIEQQKQDMNLEKAKFTSLENSKHDLEKSMKQEISAIQQRHLAEVKQLKDKLALSGDYEELSKTTDKIKKENSILISEIQKNAAVVAEKTRLSSDLQQTQQKLLETQKRCDELERMSQQNADVVHQYQGKLQQAQQSHAALENEFQKLKGELQTTQSNSAKLLNQVTMLSEKNSSTQADMDQQAAESGRVIERYDATIQELNSENTELKSQLKGVEERVNELNSQLASAVKEAKENAEASSKSSAQEKEELTKVKEQLDAAKAEAADLKDEVEKLEKKNNHLRERNWKAIDAFNTLEKSLPSKVAAAEADATKNLKELELYIKNILSDSFPEVSSDEKEFQAWCKEFISRASSSSSQIVQSKSTDPELENAKQEAIKLQSEIDEHLGRSAKLEAKVSDLEESKRRLEANGEEFAQVNQKLTEQLTAAQAECNKYRNTFNSTEEILSKLQSSVEVQDGIWRKKVEEAHQEAAKACQDAEGLRKAVEELKADNSDLHESMKEAENIRRQLNEKISQISELEEKLVLKEQANSNNGVSEDERLEKEKSLTKNLGQAATKLQSVLKQTQEHLNDERSKNQELEEKLAAGANSKQENEAIASDIMDGTSV